MRGGQMNKVQGGIPSVSISRGRLRGRGGCSRRRYATSSATEAARNRHRVPPEHQNLPPHISITDNKTRRNKSRKKRGRGLTIRLSVYFGCAKVVMQTSPLPRKLSTGTSDSCIAHGTYSDKSTLSNQNAAAARSADREKNRQQSSPATIPPKRFTKTKTKKAAGGVTRDFFLPAKPFR